METMLLEIRTYGTWALLAIACLLMLVSAAMWAWTYVRQPLDRFLALPAPMKAVSAAGLVVLVAWAGDKPPVAPAVKGVTLEPVVVTSTNAILRYSIDSDKSEATVVSNRTMWIYHKDVDNMWRLVMTVTGQTGSQFQTTVDGFFPDKDRDWKVIVSGKDGE